MVVAAIATLDDGSPFDPSLWDDFFITYTPPESELVDALERLGIDNHFHEEIAMALSRAYNNGLEFGSYNSDLHIVALWFRILRQHGIWVSVDVFDKFKDSIGNFKPTLSSDPRSLLSLHNAAHLATPSDEQALDEAISFSRRHLESMKGTSLAKLPSGVRAGALRIESHCWTPLRRFAEHI
ncbi:hypothetical protein SETIT_9G396500v2 [Setaria italica]|uniref:Terpene synthase N-terminal domain-containing protein n=1 Tax=Setaria italica TaxID=4555 RepID=K4AKG2_SETIT|nr:hypothetical protein SETIT_9G396500v2 [Setaria italica]